MDITPAVLTASNIKYLLVIHELAHEATGARSTDLANVLRVKRPSVHQRIGTVPQSKTYIASSVALQWASLAANIGMTLAVANLIQVLYVEDLSGGRV